VLIDTAVAQIAAKSPDGDPCLLAGYSFGGFVAMEVARRLVEQGRRVPFLGLIDTRAKNPLNIAPRRWRVVIAALIARSAFHSLKAIGHLTRFLPEKRSMLIQHEMNVRLRTKGLDREGMGPLQVPVTLYTSNENSPGLSDDWWHSRCNQLDVIPIGGTHHSILETPLLDTLRARFLDTVKRVEADERRIEP
jgi:thioesterase domain-containing protein